MQNIRTDILILGGGVGGVASALAACSMGCRAIMIEPYDWIGGQLTSQAVPPDEHPWIESHGSTALYRSFREAVRAHYRRFFPLKPGGTADPNLNPGGGWVSPLCHDPRVSHAILESMLLPHVVAGRLTIHRRAELVSAQTHGDRIAAASVRLSDGVEIVIEASYFLEATECGDLLPLAQVEHRTGIESTSDTGEPSAPSTARPLAMQGVTVVFAMDHVDANHVIDRPADYDYWRKVTPPGWPGPLLSWTYPNPRTLKPVTPRFRPNFAERESHEEALRQPDLWSYRRILDRSQFESGYFPSDVTLVNWPMNDYLEGPLFGVPDAEVHRARARALSLSLFYWLQTEAPRPDGGIGYSGLRLRPDVLGTDDGLAQAPYIREARRLRAVTTVVEQDLAVSVRGDAGAISYRDSVGTGAYRIDLHPTTDGDPYLDVASHPFEIPLGALIPERVENLIAAGKTIGTTHITNGCYRVHPAEWSIGEAAGRLAAFCVRRSFAPRAVQESDGILEEFQAVLQQAGADLRWRGDERLPV
ncbi:FAD-dependent oxidoreductase [Microvirga sp. WGZ8]|uniref:FAD-dependent oxidoreductase n=2 Tax=Microvirga puerhi TaxID=2876078 RepID=A0ABS7VUB0_9HYPH|nr:FAD-dependent oxidoreductase [Microvirga puerhi]MBZ6079151.1 FAD-dependent oxidoreductase [Microvirga puerhi]